MSTPKWAPKIIYLTQGRECGGWPTGSPSKYWEMEQYTGSVAYVQQEELAEALRLLREVRSRTRNACDGTALSMMVSRIVVTDGNKLDAFLAKHKDTP